MSGDSSSEPKLSYRYYPSWSTEAFAFFHGLVSSSIYLSSLAHAFSENKVSQVLLPDLKGHGEDNRSLAWEKPLEILQDFEEIWIHLKTQTAIETLSFLGHSLGASWALQILKNAPLSLGIKKVFLVAPFIQEDQIQEGWFQPESDQIRISWPPQALTGRERTLYPSAFLKSLTLQPNELQSLCQKVPVHVLESEHDEILRPLGDMFWKKLGVSSYEKVSNVSHMGLVMEKESIQNIQDWVEKVSNWSP